MTARSSYHLNLNLALPNNDNTIFWFRIIFCKSYWVMENNWFSVWTYHILERSCTWKLCPSVLNCLLLACHDLNMFCSCQGVKAKAHGIDKSWQAHMSSNRKTDSCSQHHPEVLTAQTTPTLTVYETDWYRDSYHLIYVFFFILSKQLLIILFSHLQSLFSSWKSFLQTAKYDNLHRYWSYQQLWLYCSELRLFSLLRLCLQHIATSLIGNRCHCWVQQCIIKL